MRILFLGDVVGIPGRKAIKDNLACIREEKSIDLIFVNGENASGGYGLKARHAKDFFRAGVDGITGGNHIWKYKDLYSMLESDGRMVRPLNYADHLPGTGLRIFEKKGLPPVALFNVMGRTFMPPIDCPLCGDGNSVGRPARRHPLSR